MARVGRSATVLVQGQPQREEGDGGGGGDKNRGRALQDQGRVAGPAGKLDNLKRSCQPKHHLVRPVEDPTGKAQLPHLLNL